MTNGAQETLKLVVEQMAPQETQRTSELEQRWKLELYKTLVGMLSSPNPGPSSLRQAMHLHETGNSKKEPWAGLISEAGESRVGRWAELGLPRYRGKWNLHIASLFPATLGLQFSGASNQTDPSHPGRMKPGGSNRGSHGPRQPSARLHG